MKKLIDIATDPEQYSIGSAITWMADRDRQEKQENNFWNAIRPFIGPSCKSALDIGCGSGWSANRFSSLGSLWVGLEPSSSHFAASKKAHLESDILNITFDKYETDQRFDCIIAIMVFSHLIDVKKSFDKISTLLNSGGIFIMICSTFHEGEKRLERNGRKYDVEVIDNDQYVDRAVVGAYGIADINRRTEYYIREAISSQLSLIEHVKVEDVGYSPKEILVFGKVK